MRSLSQRLLPAAEGSNELLELPAQHHHRQIRIRRTGRMQTGFLPVLHQGRVGHPRITQLPRGVSGRGRMSLESQAGQEQARLGHHLQRAVGSGLRGYARHSEDRPGQNRSHLRDVSRPRRTGHFHRAFEEPLGRFRRHRKHNRKGISNLISYYRRYEYSMVGIHSNPEQLASYVETPLGYRFYCLIALLRLPLNTGVLCKWHNCQAHLY